MSSSNSSYNGEELRRSARLRSLGPYQGTRSRTRSIDPPRNPRRQAAREVSRCRTRTRTPRSPSVYTAETNNGTAAHYEAIKKQWKKDLINNTLSIGTSMRPAKRSEILELCGFLTELRHLELQLFKAIHDQAIKNPKLATLALKTSQSIKCVEWELNEENTVHVELPALNDANKEVQDIAVWLIFFYEKIDDFYHRIFDIIERIQDAGFFTKAFITRLKKNYLTKTDQVLTRYKKFVDDMDLRDASKEAYNKMRNIICQDEDCQELLSS